MEIVFSEGRKWGVRSIVVEFGVFGAPRFSVQRSPNPLKIGIWGPLDWKSGRPKNAKSYHDGSDPPFAALWCLKTQTIPNPHLGIANGGVPGRGFSNSCTCCVFFAWTSVFAREFLLKIDTSLAIATSGWDKSVIWNPPFRKPPHLICPTHLRCRNTTKLGGGSWHTPLFCQGKLAFSVVESDGACLKKIFYRHSFQGIIGEKLKSIAFGGS